MILGRMEGGLTSRARTAFIVSIALLLSTVAVIVQAAPILGPDLASCRPVIPPRRTAAESVRCCFVDTGRPIVDFKYNLDLPMRVRRPIHTLDDEFVRKYERAYALMRALPPEDPRSWHAQSNLHCAYCAAAYSQFNATAVLDVHHGWFLFPFHRWFIYFHERILASLIGDDSFAIPYWAWDVQNATDPPANVMPDIFMNPFSSLHDPHRCHMHRPPHRVDLVIQVEPHNKDPKELLKSNYFNLWRVMRGETKTAAAFFGGKVSKGDEVMSKAGRFETGPHAAVHIWTGDELAVFGEDMAPAYTAARDPLFFNHHSQVDRLWVLWKLIGGKDLEDPDWLDAEFLFYDENADLVRVKVRDCLDNEKLRVSYESVAAEWLGHLHPPRSIRDRGDLKYKRKGQWERLWKHLLHGQFRKVGGVLKRAVALLKQEERVMLDSGRKVVTRTVARPEASLRTVVMEGQNGTNSEAEEFDEVLLISGKVTKPFDIDILFNIFVELPEADETTPLDCAESLGGIYIEAEGRSRDEIMVTREFSHVIGMGDRFQSLDVFSRTASRLSFTFVPAWKPNYDASVLVDITELKMELYRR